MNECQEPGLLTMTSFASLDLLAFDADDTLWVNEPHYTLAQEKLTQLLSQYVDSRSLTEALYETETRNLALFGYGAKSFTLSMIETAIELSLGNICGHEIQEIIDIGKALINEPIKLLPGVQDTLSQLVGSYPLMLITKGDLFDQESKLARSGLADFFQYVEIVSEKDEGTYSAILEKHSAEAQHFMMVGNSLRSDILPVLNIGGYAAYVPYQITWLHEQVPALHTSEKAYFELESIEQLPDLLHRVFEWR